MKNSLLFGNGLNLLGNDTISWDQLLNRLQKKRPANNGKLPNTMIYEKIFLERCDFTTSKYENKEMEIKNEIAEELSKQDTNEYYRMIIDLNFDDYLTTNYDYAFRNSFSEIHSNNSTEGIYSIRRNSSMNNASNCRLWNIHGEIDHPKSIMLGLDHYCGSIGKIDSYIKGKYEYQADGKIRKTKKMIDKIRKDCFDGVSWVELFFKNNIHILGLSLDYCETDLWWVLNKRARSMLDVKIRNKIYFYTCRIEEEKKRLLESLHVKVVENPIVGKKYFDCYLKAIKFISKISSKE